MQEVKLKKTPVDYKQFVKRSAVEDDYEQLLDGDVIGVDQDTSKVIFVHKKLDFDDTDILWALDRIKYEENTRTSGLKTRSRIFGYNPRNTVRKDFCSTVSLAVQQPREHAVVCKYGVQIAGLYSQFTPETYQQHKDIMKSKVLDEWSIKDTPFTSGIINKNNPLKYHFDSGNFKNVYSCMAVFKRDVRGGVLVLARIWHRPSFAAQLRLHVRWPKRPTWRNANNQAKRQLYAVFNRLLFFATDMELLATKQRGGPYTQCKNCPGTGKSQRRGT